MIRIILKESKAIAIKKHPEFAEQIEAAFKNGIKSGHLPWVAFQLSRKEPFNEIVGTIKEFYKNHNNPKITEKDLLKYDRLADLRTAIENSVSDRHKKITATPEADDYDVIFNSDQYILVFPKSKEASCKLGQGTQWCVAATQSKNYFDDYSGKNVFLYFASQKGKDPKDDPMFKIAFAFTSGQDYEIFDAEDNNIDFLDMNNGMRSMFNMAFDDVEKKEAARYETPKALKKKHMRHIASTTADAKEQIEILESDDYQSLGSSITSIMMKLNPNIQYEVLEKIVEKHALSCFHDYMERNQHISQQFLLDMFKLERASQQIDFIKMAAEFISDSPHDFAPNVVDAAIKHPINSLRRIVDFLNNTITLTPEQITVLFDRIEYAVENKTGGMYPRKILDTLQYLVKRTDVTEEIKNRARKLAIDGYGLALAE